MSNYDRNGTSDDNMVRAQAIFNPERPEDLALALQNPNSDAYKNLQELLLAGVEHQDLVRKLVETFLTMQQQSNDKKQLEAIYRWLKRSDREQQETMDEFVKQQARVNQAALANVRPDLGRMKDMLKVLPAEIEALTARIDGYKNSLNQILEQQKAFNDHWPEMKAKQQSDIETYMQKNHILLAGHEATSKEGKEIIAAMVNAPSPLDVQQKIYASLELASLQPHDPSIPPPPPPPPAPKPGKAFVASNAEVAAHIRALGKMAEGREGGVVGLLKHDRSVFELDKAVFAPIGKVAVAAFELSRAELETKKNLVEAEALRNGMVELQGKMEEIVAESYRPRPTK